MDKVSKTISPEFSTSASEPFRLYTPLSVQGIICLCVLAKQSAGSSLLTAEIIEQNS
jgi:hypothetical protein